MQNQSNSLITFDTQLKTALKACLYLFMVPWQWHIRQFNYQKAEVRVYNLL